MERQIVIKGDDLPKSVTIYYQKSVVVDGETFQRDVVEEKAIDVTKTLAQLWAELSGINVPLEAMAKPVSIKMEVL